MWALWGTRTIDHLVSFPSRVRFPSGDSDSLQAEFSFPSSFFSSPSIVTYPMLAGVCDSLQTCRDYCGQEAQVRPKFCLTQTFRAVDATSLSCCETLFHSDLLGRVRHP